MKLYKVLNYILVMILVLTWGSIFVIQGILGAISWNLAIFILAPIGVILTFVNIIVLGIGMVKKKNVKGKIISLVLSMALAVPILMMLDILSIKYPVNIDEVTPDVTVMWPLKERTIVGWGGDSIKTNKLHVKMPSERWAYDLVMEPSNIGSKEVQDYGIYDKEVIAPVSGTVVGTCDKEEDIEPNSEDDNFKSMEGNYIYIKIDKTGTFLVLCHLKKDSITVKVGEHVDEGMVIGKVGNTGATSEPHLHIHHQRQEPGKNSISLICAEGLPLYFKGIDGQPMPRKGDNVTPNN